MVRVSAEADAVTLAIRKAARLPGRSRGRISFCVEFGLRCDERLVLRQLSTPEQFAAKLR